MNIQNELAKLGYTLGGSQEYVEIYKIESGEAIGGFNPNQSEEDNLKKCLEIINNEK